MNRDIPLQIRYAEVITPDFNSLVEEQVRCMGCEHPMWPEDNAAGGPDETYCATCVANSCAGCLDILEPDEPCCVNGSAERFCASCATEMSREYASAMAR